MLRFATILVLALYAAPKTMALPGPDWTVSYTRTCNGFDEYMASSIDGTGNTFVIIRENRQEIRLMEYDASGVVKKNAVIDVEGADVTSVTTDASGNVIVAGNVYNLATGWDIYVAKYNGGTTSRIWSNAYDSGLSLDDNAYCVAASPSGSIYVAGSCVVTPGVHDSVVAAFNPAGGFLWDDVADVSTTGDDDEWYAVAADTEGNCYVAGSFYDSFSIGTAVVSRYNVSSPLPASWINTYVVSGNDYGRALTYNSGTKSLFLAADDASTIGVFKINPSTGGELDSGTYSGGMFALIATGGITVDGSGNPAVAGYIFDIMASSSTDLLLVKFNAALSPSWNRTYDHGGFDGMNMELSIGGLPVAAAQAGFAGSGELILSGAVLTTCVPADIFVRRYSAAGGVQWTRIYDGPPMPNYVEAATDVSGNVYVGGSAGTDPFLLKYSGAGAFQWVKLPNYGCMGGAGGIVQQGGNVYLSIGVFNDKVLIEKYNSAGSQIGSYPFYFPFSVAGPMAIDLVGNIYMAGTFANSTTFEDDMYVAKYNSIGTLQWTRTLTRAVDDSPQGIALDGLGGVYVVESTTKYSAGGENKMCLVKLDVSGQVTWTRTYSSSSSLETACFSVTVSGTNVYLSGVESDPASGAMWGRIYKLDSAGNEVWTRNYNGGQDAAFFGSAVSTSSNIYLAGSIGSAVVPSWNMLTVSYDPAGSLRWNESYDSGKAHDSGHGLAFGSVYVAGDNGTDVLLVKYTANASLISSLAIDPGNASLGQPVLVVLSVTNLGSADALGVTPGLDVNTGGGFVSFVSGPPPGPVVIGGGGSQKFTWTYNASGAGTVTFTGTASGQDSESGAAVLTRGSAVLVIHNAAELKSSLSYSSAVVNPGQLFTVYLTVTNTGIVSLAGILPSIDLNTGGGLVSTFNGPFPAGPVSLAVGSSTTFTWTYSASGAGVVSLCATAFVTGTIYTVSTGFVVISTNAPALTSVMTVAPVSALRGGETFEVRFTVSNSGSYTTTLTRPSLVLSNNALARIDSAPSEAGEIAVTAGSSVTFIWRLTVLSRDSAALVLTATSQGTSAQVSVTIRSKPGGAIVAYPNPVTKDWMDIYLRLENDASAVSVEAYDSAIHQVFSGKWGTVPLYDGTLKVEGMGNWAPGVYLLRVRATLVDGKEQKFPVIKVVVKR